MRRHTLFLVVGFLLAAASSKAPSAPPPGAAASAADPAVFDASWAQTPLWDDGQAEVALYEARRPQYGKIESYEAVLIVVKEEFNRNLYVKAEPPFEGKSVLPVLKLNSVHSYWTPNYPYHFLASIFVRRDDPSSLVKLTVGSQEWCGNTFKEVKAWNRPAELVFHSYFDGEGDGSRALHLRPGDLFEDQLPLALRSLRFAPKLQFRTQLLPSLLTNKLGGQVELRDAEIRVEAQETLASPQGRVPAWRVRVSTQELAQTYWFAAEAPHPLLKMDSSDGRSLKLKQLTRKPYWKTATYQPTM